MALKSKGSNVIKISKKKKTLHLDLITKEGFYLVGRVVGRSIYLSIRLHVRNHFTYDNSKDQGSDEFKKLSIYPIHKEDYFLVYVVYGHDHKDTTLGHMTCHWYFIAHMTRSKVLVSTW